MALDPAARLRESENTEIPMFFSPEIPHKLRLDSQRRHVLNRSTQEKSGRLYCSDDWDFDIPSLEIYAAR